MLLQYSLHLKEFCTHTQRIWVTEASYQTPGVSRLMLSNAVMAHHNVFMIGNRVFTYCVNFFKHLMTRLHKDTKKTRHTSFQSGTKRCNRKWNCHGGPFWNGHHRHCFDVNESVDHKCDHYCKPFMGRHIHNGKIISYIPLLVFNMCCIGSFTLSKYY